MERDEAEYLRKLQEHVAETRRLFSNTMKPERERMVCRAFLRCVGIKFCDQEIIASDTEPVDVVFRSAKFQIRELLGSDRKRGDELKDSVLTSGGFDLPRVSV
jgi:very-short-patch-repair endonuclease